MGDTFLAYFCSPNVLLWMLYTAVFAIWNTTLLFYFLKGPQPTKRQRISSQEKLRIAFIHPELVQGGAERLVVELASGLQKKGHHVEIFTGYHDKTRCFKETIDGSFHVNVHGMWMPRSFFGSMTLPFALLKIFYVSTCLLLKHKREGFYDIIIIDQIPSAIPLLKLSNTKIVYYCHFPDMLMSSRGSLIKRLYRLPLDYLEERTTSKADLTLVNSKFTLATFKRTFKSIQIEPTVLYPSVGHMENDVVIQGPKDKKMILSLNRYEKKKNIGLAIDAFHVLLNKFEYNERKDMELVIAGGYDIRVKENVSYLKELKLKASDYGIETQVKFLTSITDTEKMELLKKCTVLLYTPENEHFGIVPLEAGLARKPCIVCNSGGPMETVVDHKTGFLLPSDKEKWADAMYNLVTNGELAVRMGADASNHVRRLFSTDVILTKLEGILNELLCEKVL